MLFLLLFLKIHIIFAEENEEDEEETIVKPKNKRVVNWASHIIPEFYTSNIPPSLAINATPGPTEIECAIIPMSITGVSVKTMDFDVDLDIEIRWRDFRLIIIANVSNSSTVVPKDIKQRLWFPRVSFRNCKMCDEFIFTTAENALSISPENKELSVQFRKVVKFVCVFDLKYYPFDYQVCYIKMDALYTERYAVLKPAQFDLDDSDHQVNLPPEFTLVVYNVTGTDCTISRPGHESRSCLKHTFVFKRQIAHYLMIMYAPSILIVMLSWVSFWLDVEVAAPRVAVALTSLLTLATQFSNVQNHVPSVASVKAIDVWMFVCIFMVFASLIEYAFANYLHRLKKAKKSEEDTFNAQDRRLANAIYFKADSLNRNPHKSKNVNKEIVAVKRKTRCHNCLKTQVDTCPLDNFSRFAFPLMFVLFNIFYWIFYQNIPVVKDEDVL